MRALRNSAVLLFACASYANYSSVANAYLPGMAWMAQQRSNAGGCPRCLLQSFSMKNFTSRLTPGAHKRSTLVVLCSDNDDTCQSSSSSRMRVVNHNWSATKQRLHPQSVAEVSRHSGDRIRQCGTSCQWLSWHVGCIGCAKHCASPVLLCLTLYSLRAVPRQIMWSWYTGRWWVACYIWYSKEGTGRAPSPPINCQCTNHRIAVLGMSTLLCSFNVGITGLKGHTVLVTLCRS